MPKSYDSKDIVILEGLDAVRLRPGMYIGTTGQKGMHHLLWEIVDNSIDEISNGFGDKITITLHSDGSASVEDNGRGIPVDIHPVLKKSGVEVVFTKLHAGGKFDNGNYNFSGGLHGVGASVANALSSWLKVTVLRNGKKYFMEFESTEDSKGKIHSGIPKSPLEEIGTSTTTGTIVRFMPDERVFKDAEFSFDIISRRLKELAFLNKGINLIFIDEKNNQRIDYYYKGGIADFTAYLNEGKNKMYEPVVFVSGQSQRLLLELAFQHTDSFTENIFSYVNNIPTTEGGTHETGLKSALTKVFNDVARKLGLLKDKEDNLLGEDFREGITLVLSIKMQECQFEGQTKTKLGNPEAKIEVENIVSVALAKFLDGKDKTKIIESIITKAKGAAKVREASKKAKDLARQRNSVDNYNLVGKLSACSSRKSELCEMFIVEGDSAGGSAKQARDRTFQAILPLKGKPLNAEKKRLDQVLANEEIRTIISALETSIGEDFNASYLRYDKIIILSDADQDGAHIRAILLTFFFRYMRELINSGHVYIGLPPLYKVYRKDTVLYVYSDAELPEAIQKIGKGYAIQRYKGLGEMNPEQLWETTMDPQKRTLVQVTIDDAADAERMITTLMGDDIDSRKEYISQHANFNRKDDFLEKIKFEENA
ncbi:MAG: DNA gyrase subunit B [Clostridia bacterium]